MALSRIPAPYIIYLQEDYLLDKPVDTGRVLSLLNYLQTTQAGCIRLYPCPGPDIPIQDNEEVGIISQNAEYRVSLQAAIWDKKILESLLINGETAWHMEIYGTLRSRMLDMPFYSVKSAALSYFCTAVVRGKWKKEAIEFCDREGIKIDLSKRPIEGLTSFTLNDIKNLIDLKKFKEAESALTEARAQNPNSPDLLNLQAVLKIHMGDNEGAKAILLDLIKRWPAYFPAYNNLALIFWDGGDYENAVKYFEEALRISNFDRSVVFSYGDMLLSHKKYAKGKRSF
jgi:tetratricopeptide (TPR) repeat protein